MLSGLTKKVPLNFFLCNFFFLLVHLFDFLRKMFLVTTQKGTLSLERDCDVCFLKKCQTVLLRHNAPCMVLIVLVMIKQWIQMDSATLWRHSSRSVQHVLLTDKHYNITRPRFPAMGIHTYLWCLKNLKIGYQSVSITTNIYVPESVISILLLFMIFSTSGGDH